MRHERGGTANLRCKKVSTHGLAVPARLQGARVRWLGELAVQESKLARISRPGKIARGTKGGSPANLRRRKESKLARLSRPGKVARGTREVTRRTCGAGKQERGGSVNLRCRKVSSHGLADPARLQEARARWLGELVVQENNLSRVSKPGKVARGTREVTRRTCGAGKKVSSHGLADPARLQVALAGWLYELAVQESKLVRVSRPGKQARQGCKRHELGGSANLRCRKANSHGLADPARLQETRARWLGELAVQESKLARVSGPGKVARDTSEVARRTCDARKLQKAGARWLGELAVQESKLARVSRPGKVSRGMSKTRQGFKGHEQGGSANLRFKKVNSHGLADPARLQGAGARWFGELAVQESKLARVSRPGKVARGTREVTRRTFGAGKKVSSHGLADPARLQVARARWLYELAVQESKLVRVSRPGKVGRGTSEVARRTCDARKKVSSHGLADPARLQVARARWLYELAVQESKLVRVSRPGKVGRGTSEVARRTCGAGKKVNSHGLADPASLQEARARWLGELAMQESKLERVSRPRVVARGTSEVARRTWGCRKVISHGIADPTRLLEARARKVISQGLANPERLQEARARWLYELAVQESCKRQERGGSANLRCRKVSSHGFADPARLQEARARKVSSHGLADPARLQEARARWLGELAVQESKLARVSRPGKVARGTSEVARRTCGAGK
ncbi:hypothetical protein CRG98_042324 [Punica granatum]|uniref:Uncharacterized protein n=1 Tax=Punica granatum TaxID=22663 RepID=A0A2I0HZZ0_PUNGR|nr:hypothetical protein CRG98_042324 [Punica granatum]